MVHFSNLSNFLLDRYNFGWNGTILNNYFFCSILTNRTVELQHSNLSYACMQPKNNQVHKSFPLLPVSNCWLQTNTWAAFLVDQSVLLCSTWNSNLILTGTSKLELYPVVIHKSQIHTHGSTILWQLIIMKISE